MQFKKTVFLLHIIPPATHIFGEDLIEPGKYSNINIHIQQYEDLA